MVRSINSQNVGEERVGSLTLASVLWYKTFQSKRSDNIKYIGEYRNSHYVTVIAKLVKSFDWSHSCPQDSECDNATLGTVY